MAIKPGTLNCSCLVTAREDRRPAFNPAEQTALPHPVWGGLLPRAQRTSRTPSAGKGTQGRRASLAFLSVLPFPHEALAAGQARFTEGVGGGRDGPKRPEFPPGFSPSGGLSVMLSPRPLRLSLPSKPRGPRLFHPRTQLICLCPAGITRAKRPEPGRSTSPRAQCSVLTFRSSDVAPLLAVPKETPTGLIRPGAPTRPPLAGLCGHPIEVWPLCGVRCPVGPTCVKPLL